jgi:hypothetical protein
MKILKAAVSGALMLGLLLVGNSAQSAEPIPGSEKGWYQCTSSVQGQVQAPEPKKVQEVQNEVRITTSVRAKIQEPKPIEVAEVKIMQSARKAPVKKIERRNYFCQQSGMFREEIVESSVYHRSDNTTPEEGGRYWKSPLITQPKDAYSLKRPAGNATVSTAVMPASLPKFSKGATWGVVAVNQESGKIVRGKITPSGPDSKNGQQPAVIIFEEPVEPGSKLVASDRWYNNSFFSRKRGELVIWNPGTAKWEKLSGGMWLERDPSHMALVAETYGADLESREHAVVTPTEGEQIPKRLGFTKVASPDGVRYTPVDIPVFKKLYAKPSLVRWHQRFANNGGLAIGIPPSPVGAAMNVGVAALTAFIDTKHNVPCLSTLKGGQDRFECDQKFYESGKALTTAASAQLKKGGKGKAGIFSDVSYSGRQNTGQVGIGEILANIGPSSPTYPQTYDWPGFWLEAKRAEWPSGAGMFRSPSINTEYAFSNSYLHLFGGEVAPNATLHWGPSHKIDYWKYCTSSGYKGRGHFYGVGATTELVTSHKWGGTDNRFAFWYGYEQIDKGRSHSDRRHPWMFEWQTELWWHGVKLGKDGRYGSMFDGAKIGVLAKTNDSLLAWLFPVIYRTPHDIAKVSVGPQFLHFFSRDGDEPKGGGLGVQVEVMDGLGYRFSYFPFKKGMYHTGWADPYRVYMKLKELEAEFGIYEVPWDSYTPKSTPVVAQVVAPIAPKIATSPPVIEQPPVKIKKEKRLTKKGLRNRCPVKNPEVPINVPQPIRPQTNLTPNDGHQQESASKVKAM